MGCFRPRFGGMIAMTTGLAGQQQACPDRCAARQSMDSGPRHRGSAGEEERSALEVPRPVKLGCRKFTDML